jgi:hypothetical protein
MGAGAALGWTLALVLVLLREGDAHTRLVCPAPRSPIANKKVGCGADAGVKGPVTVLSPGLQTIHFEEFVFHSGAPARLALSTSGGVTQAAFDTCVLLNHVPHHETSSTGKYSITVMIPDVACDNCVLQLTQFMLDKITAPNCTFDPLSETGGECRSNYFSCADVQITGTQPAAGFTCPPQPAAWPFKDLPRDVYEKDWNRGWKVDNVTGIRTLLTAPELSNFTALVGTCASPAALAAARNTGIASSPTASPDGTGLFAADVQPSTSSLSSFVIAILAVGLLGLVGVGVKIKRGGGLSRGGNAISPSRGKASVPEDSANPPSLGVDL